MSARATATAAALLALGRQFLLWVDQGGNALLVGLYAVLVAALTGERQNPAYADETLSAHAWRSSAKGARWARFFRPLIDLLFLWQGEDEEVNLRARKRVTGHCERAYWKELLRRELPEQYRDFVNKEMSP